MNERIAWIIGIAAALAVGVAIYLFRDRVEEPVPQAAPAVESAAGPAEPAIRHPVPPPPAPEAAAQPPLPPLAESDAPVQEALTGALGQGIAPLLVPDGIVRRFVATVDNLPRKKAAARVRPVVAVEGAFAVSGSEDELTLAEENYARYAPFMSVVQAADPAQLAAVYLRFYPLMQESYEGLGYPNRYFNDRMVEVIDHLLATPEVRGPVRLKQPHVLYEFADPRLESLSAGQKALIRIGGANAAMVKKQLAALRREITRQRQP